MFCCKCGTKLADDSRFCNKCGTAVSGHNPSMVAPQAQEKTTQMVCQECGGVMNMDGERTILMCPYCGSKKLIVENDEVKIARIKASTHKAIAEMILNPPKRERQEEFTKAEKQLFIGIGIFMVILIVAGILLSL